MYTKLKNLVTLRTVVSIRVSTQMKPLEKSLRDDSHNFFSPST